MKILKNSAISTVIIIALFMLSACNNNEYNALDYVSLFDYKNIEMEESYLQLSEADLEIIINMDFQTKEYYEITDKKIIETGDKVLLDIKSNDEFICSNYYYEVGSEEIDDTFDEFIIGKKAETSFETSLKIDDVIMQVEVFTKGIYVINDANDFDKVLEFYGFETMDETVSYLKERASDEIIFNYMWDKILENSQLKSFPKAIEKKIDDIFLELVSQEEQLYSSDDIESIKQSTYDYYYELMLAQAILKDEKQEVDSEDIDEYVEDLAQENSINIDDIGMYLSDEDIYYQTTMRKVKNIIVDYIIIKS